MSVLSQVCLCTICMPDTSVTRGIGSPGVMEVCNCHLGASIQIQFV